MSLWRVIVKGLADGPKYPGEFLCDASSASFVTYSFNTAKNKGLAEKLTDGRFSITPLGIEWVNGQIEEYIPVKKRVKPGRPDNTKVLLRATWLRAFPAGVSITPVNVLL